MKLSKQKDEKAPLCYSTLTSQLRTYLKHRAPDPEGLDNSEIKRFMKEFQEQFSEPEKPALNVKTMRRLMKTAVAERRRIKKLRKSRHYNAATAPASD